MQCTLNSFLSLSLSLSIISVTAAFLEGSLNDGSAANHATTASLLAGIIIYHALPLLPLTRNIIDHDTAHRSSLYDIALC